MTDRVVDADTATHRIADDVNGVEPQQLDKGDQSSVCGHHRVTAEVVADAETGEFQNQATEMLGEGAEDAARKFLQPVTPGPEPCRSSRGAPSPAS